MKFLKLPQLRQRADAYHTKMARRRRKWQRTWGFESLEQRALLAAVTSVQTSGLGITAGTGSLNADDVATLTVNFDAAVLVTRDNGSPTLTLNTGAKAYYTGGSGTTALNFQYIVGARQNTSDLTVTAMSTNGSTIQTAGVNATLTGAVTNPAGTLAIDTFAPTATITRIGATSQTAGTPLQFSVAFSEAVTGIATSSFSLTTVGVTGAAVSSVVQGDAANYTVTVSSSGAGTVGLNITGATVKDIAGNGLGGGSFAVGSGFSTGSSPRSIATADFNNDGRMDWVVANGSTGNVTVMLGNGTGGASIITNINVGSTPAFVSTADVNADGRPDIIVANSGSANISVLLANSAVAGAFLAATNFSVAGNPVSLSLADFNADGKLDLAVAHGTTSASILLGSGAGGFTATTNAVVPTGTNKVVAVDVSGDGRPDLVTSSSSLGSVGVALGSATATFGTSTTFPLINSPSGIVVNHFNSDANLDIAGTSAVDPFIGLIGGTGNGNFVLSSQIFIASGLVGIASADLTGDSKVDVAAISNSAASFYYAPGNGDLSFGAVKTSTLSGTPSALALADINGDGRLDALVANTTSNNLVPVLNNPPVQTGPVFTVTNQAPTDLSLSNSAVREEQSAGLLVGTLTTTDSNANDAFQYTLVTGTDSTDNASFKISGNQLRTNSIFDFESKSSMKVRVRTTDSGGLFVERAFTIQVLDEFEAESPTFIQQLTPAATLSNPIGAQFGKSLAINSDYYLIGAPQVNSGAFSSSGQAFLYSASTGQLLQTFNNPSPGNADQMGWSVALSGNTVLLGANFDSVGSIAAGRAMLFNALTGSLMATLNNPTPATSDMFGVSVAAGNGFLAVGAARDAFNTTTTSGSVHVYNSSGVFQYTIVNPAPSVGSQFGQAIAMDGTTLVAASSDAVYVFNVTTGAILRTITNPTGSRTDRFGAAVALSGNRLAVGSTDGLASGVRSGNVRVYDISSGALLQTYTPLASAVGDSFGASLSIDSQSLTVGAPGTDVGGVSDVGAAYLYNLSTGALRGGMSNPSPTSGDQFGAAVATLGVKSIVGTPFDDTNGSDQGNVFVYSRVAAFAVSFSASTMTENNAVGAVVGTFTATAGANAPVSYALVSGTGGTDNASFTIVGSQLRANTVFNYEAKSNYSVLIEATDAVGMKSRLIASITVLDINEAPTNIELSNSSIEEMKPIGTAIGTLSTADPDGDTSFVYTLTTGPNFDNNYFLVVGNQLQSNLSFDYETRNQYQIEVRSQDNRGLSTTKVLTVRINDVNQPADIAQPRYDLQIVADLNSTIQNSNPSYAVEMNGHTYFTASSLVNGRELYRVNAVSGATEMVADLAWDTGDANPQSLVVMGGSLYFTASYSYLDPSAPPGGVPQTLFGIWKSDGTATGTVLVRQIETVVSSLSNAKPGFVVGNRALFFVGDENIGEQLWATDGTTNGTSLIQTFPSSFGFASSSFPAVVAGGKLYFNRSVDTSFGNHSLWRTDGTAAGTLELRQVSSFMPLDSSNPFDPSLTALGSTVYFSSFDASTGLELWKTDGTISSTVQVADINSFTNAAPTGMIAFQGSLYFSANDGTNNRELWKSNGTTMSMVANIGTSLFGDSLSALSERFTVFGGHLYFTADDGSGAGLQLYRTDGSGPGTVAFPRDGATVFNPTRLVALPDRLLIINDYYGPSANQLWSTDGTQVGNQLLTNFVSISSVATSRSQAFLGLNDGTLGNELWTSNGLPAGTQLLSDFRPGINGGLTDIIAISQGRAILAVNDGVRGAELGTSDGTVAGTRFIDVARGTPASDVTDVAQIGSSLYIATKQGLYLSQTETGVTTLLTTKDATELTAVGSKMFFVAAATTISSNRELWVSDGTVAGTKLVYDIRTGATGSDPSLLTAYGGLVYFVATDGVNGRELWRSGGAANDPLNTTMFFQFGAGAADGNIEHLEVVGDNLYILAGGKLYIRNSNNSFTLLAANASSLMAWNGIVYFSGYTSDTGNELWRTDGTVVGTYMVKDIVPGPTSSYPGGGVVANEDPSASRRAATESRLVFRALDASGAAQLFATNGTSAGTVSLTNAPFIDAGFGLVPVNLTTVGNQVYFQGYSQATGLELWTSDGTAEGTRLVADLRPGTYPNPLNNDPSNPVSFSNLNEMTAFRDKLFFSADSPAAGRELWVSDGSAGGSYMVKDIREGSSSGSPKRLFVLGDRLYLAADTDDYGIGTLGSGELFRLNESPSLSGQSSIVVTGSPIQFRLDGADNDGDALTYQVLNAPQHGTLTISGNAATYTSLAGYTGLDSFGIVARDGSLNSDTANFTLAVRASVPTITFAIASSIINEGDQAFVANVTLSAPATEDLNLPYAYGFGDSESQNVVSFAVGQTTSQIVIPFTNDNAYQAVQRQLEVTLKSNSYAALGSITQHVATILDDEAPPKIFFVDFARTFSEVDGTINVEVGLSNAAETTVTATISLNALLGGGTSDFTYAPQTQVTFMPGQVRQNVLVRIINDQLPESREGLLAGIAAVSGASIIADPTRFRSLIWIADDDASVINLTPANTLVTEGDTLTLIATRTGGTLSTPLNVGFTTFLGGTAVADYSLSSSVFQFAAGASQATITFTAVDDGLVDAFEGVTFILAESPSYAIGDQSTAYVGIYDNDTTTVTFDYAPEEKTIFDKPVKNYWESVLTNRQIRFVAKLSAPSDTTISIPMVVSDGTQAGYAKLGSDFSFSTANVVFAPGVTEVSRTLVILDDDVPEGIEKLTIALAPAPNQWSLRPQGTLSDAGLSQTLTITDDDYGVAVRALNPADGKAKNTFVENAGTVNFEVSLNRAPDEDVRVDLSLTTSMLRSEFTAAGFNANLERTIVLRKGTQSMIVPIQLNDDSLFEKSADKLTLKAARTNGFYFDATNSTTVTITDNEKPPALRFSSGAGLRLSDNSDSLLVGLELDAGAPADTKVKISFGGTAVRDKDYRIVGAASAGVLNIGTGELSFGIEILPLDNKVLDGDKTVDIGILPLGALAISIPSEGIKTTATIVETAKASSACSTTSVSSQPFVLALPSVDSCVGPLNVKIDSGSLSNSTVDLGYIPDYLAGQIAVITTQQGIIDGSTVFFDSNFNGVQDYLDQNRNGRQEANEPNEPGAVSDLGGTIALTIPSGFDRNADGLIDSTEGRLVSVGGTDTATGLPWNMVMSAPFGIYAVTPLTTVLQTLMQRNSLTQAVATETVQAAFGLASFNIAGGNTIYNVLSKDAAAALAYTRQVAISSASILTASLFSGQNNESRQQFEQQWMDLLASVVASQKTTVDLSNPDLIKQLITAINRTLATPLAQDVVNGATKLISLGIGRAQTIRLEQFAEPMQFLEAITRVKKLMHGSLADDLKQVGAGTKLIATALSAYNGASAPNFDSLAAIQTIGQIIPPVLGVTSVNIQEGPSGTRTLDFEVELLGAHSSTVTAQYATVDGTATSASGDYVPASGTLTWLPGDNSTRIASVTVNSDAEFELDEFLSLILRNATNAVVRRAQGFGGIQNDDTLSLANTTIAGNFGVVYAEDISFVRNGSLVQRGPLLNPIDAVFTGAVTEPTEFSIDFASSEARADQYTLVGGTAADLLSINSGRFDKLIHVINANQRGWSSLRSEQATESKIDWTSIDNFDYSVSTLGEMVIQVPTSVSSVIIDDPDQTTTGVMRVHSASNEFAPIYFTAPASKLTIVKLNQATTVSTVTTDPAFTGNVEVLFGGVTPTANQIAENLAAGSVVGSFATVNPILVGSYQVALVSGEGDGGNSMFTIGPDGKTLQTAASINFESANQYSIRTRTTGLYETEFETVFSVIVVNQNETPTDLKLTRDIVSENSPIGSVVGSLQTTDPDAGNTFTYAFVSGGGRDDNSAFTIDEAGVVRSGVALDYETKSSFAIQVLATDQGGLTFEKTLTITVANMLEISQPIRIGDGTAQRSVVNRLVLTFDQSVNVDLGAFVVQQRERTAAGNLQLNTVATAVTLTALAGGGSLATLTFSGAYTRAGTNGLVDGNYQLTINGSLIRSLATNMSLDADSNGVAGGQRTLGTADHDNFFALLGDANGNGEVDSQDLLGANNALRSRVGQPNYNLAYDINGNGQIDTQDLLSIQNNYRRRRVFF